MKWPCITHFGKRIIVPKDAIIFIGDKEWNRHFCVVLEEGNLLPAVIQNPILVLAEPIPGITGSCLKRLRKIVITFTVKYGGLKTASCNWFFIYYFFAICIPKRNHSCFEIDNSSKRLRF